MLRSELAAGAEPASRGTAERGGPVTGTQSSDGDTEQ